MRVLQGELEVMGSLKYAAEKELRVAKEARGALEIRLMELDAKATAAVRTAEEMKAQVAQAGMLVQRVSVDGILVGFRVLGFRVSGIRV
jgi:transcription elongation GreA/GreB family factor